MALEMKKEKVQTLQTLCKADSQKNVDFEVNLPDYCTDIKKILKCLVCPGVSSYSAVGDMVKVTGSATVRLIYINEKDKPDCYETSKDFVAEVKLQGLPVNGAVKTFVKTNYVNCRALSQRRVSINANLSVGACASAVRELTLLTEVSGEGMQEKRGEKEIESIIACKEKVFEMGETAALPEEKPAIGKILSVDAYGVIESKKAVSDKLLIKGQLVTKLLYLCDEKGDKTETFLHSMPISQIIDLPGIDEKSLCRCTCEIKELLISVKADASSSNRLVEIGAKVGADVKCSETKKVKIIEDAYSVSHETQQEYTIREFSCPIHGIDSRKTHKQTLELTSEKVKEIIDIRCCEATCSFSGKEDKAAIHCSAVLGVLYVDASDCFSYCEKTVDFDMSVKLNRKYEFLRCTPEMQIRGIDYRLSGRDKLEISLEAGISAEIYSGESCRILCDVKTGEKKDKKNSAALTLYFSHEGESLWEIAKRYDTTVELILGENDMKEEKEIKEQMLMIPCV